MRTNPGGEHLQQFRKRFFLFRRHYTACDDPAQNIPRCRYFGIRTSSHKYICQLVVVYKRVYTKSHTCGPGDPFVHVYLARDQGVPDSPSQCRCKCACYDQVKQKHSGLLKPLKNWPKTERYVMIFQLSRKSRVVHSLGLLS